MPARSPYVYCTYFMNPACVGVVVWISAGPGLAPTRASACGATRKKFSTEMRELSTGALGWG